MNPVRTVFSFPAIFNRRRRWLLTLTLALAGLSSQAQAQGALSYLSPLGGPGGGQFKSPCRPGEYLTGVDLHAADDVDAIRPVCIGSNGVASPNANFAGGPGGKPVTVRCPSNTPTVIAIAVAAEGAATIVVNNIHLFCGQPVASQTIPKYPSAVFDGPAAVASKGLPGMIDGQAILRSGDYQACPPGQIAVGINGRSGVWLDAVGLICGPAPAAPAGPKEPVKSIGRINMPQVLTPPGSICDSAASAHSRNSPAAPSLDTQCNALKELIAANEKKDLTPGPSGTPVSLCDAAQAALDRNAPEAVDLSSKCRAAGGGQNLTSQAEQLAVAGEAIAAGDPLLTEFRKRQPGGATLRGFDVGVGVCGKQSEWGPGKQKVLESLPPSEQDGFKIAISFVLDRNRNAEFAALGAAIAAMDPLVNSTRTKNPDVRYWLGFDIASGLFGNPAQGGKGHTSTGPGSDAIRNGLSLPAQKGFNDAVQFHLSRK
jgi:hypothetical protein